MDHKCKPFLQLFSVQNTCSCHLESTFTGALLKFFFFLHIIIFIAVFFCNCSIMSLCLLTFFLVIPRKIETKSVLKHLTDDNLLFLSVLLLYFSPPLQILHHHIASVEKLSLTTSGCPLVIQCRNFRVVHFVVQRERDCHDIYSSLLRLLRPGGFKMCPSTCIHLSFVAPSSVFVFSSLIYTINMQAHDVISY